MKAMAKKTILLIEDDRKVEERLLDMLASEYKVEVAKGYKEAVSFLSEKAPQLIIIDFDLKGDDGLQVFREIRHLRPEVNVVMLSNAGSIPLAVSATKSGVAGFLRKPISSIQLKEVVEHNIARFEKSLNIPSNLWWLKGQSKALEEMRLALKRVVKENANIILFAERGIEKKQVAEIIHKNGTMQRRKLAALDLAAFNRNAMESHFWTILRKLLALPDASSLGEEADLCGTIYLENFDSLDEHFKTMLLGFIKERKGQMDKAIRIILGVSSIAPRKIKDYTFLAVSPLRDRAADLPCLLAELLAHYANKYNKKVRLISTELLLFLVGYDYPGNYVELQKMIEGAVLLSNQDRLEIKHLPFNFSELVKVMVKRAKTQGLTLEKAKIAFEKQLYDLLLEKTEGDASRAARFLDIPKSTFVQRIEELEVYNLSD